MHVPSYFAFLALALPLLNPLTFGPTHPVAQSLTVWVAAALCWLTWELARVNTQRVCTPIGGVVGGRHCQCD
jgi:hypothetical protein